MVGNNKMQQSNANRLIMDLSPFGCLVISPLYFLFVEDAFAVSSQKSIT
jgi:hypothetical protein